MEPLRGPATTRSRGFTQPSCGPLFITLSSPRAGIYILYSDYPKRGSVLACRRWVLRRAWRRFWALSAVKGLGSCPTAHKLNHKVHRKKKNCKEPGAQGFSESRILTERIARTIYSDRLLARDTLAALLCKNSKALIFISLQHHVHH